MTIGSNRIVPDSGKARQASNLVWVYGKKPLLPSPEPRYSGRRESQIQDWIKETARRQRQTQYKKCNPFRIELFVSDYFRLFNNQRVETRPPLGVECSTQHLFEGTIILERYDLEVALAITGITCFIQWNLNELQMVSTRNWPQ